MTNPTIAGALRRRKTLIGDLGEFEPFEQAGRQIEDRLRGEVAKDGVRAVVEHLYLCGAIPEGLEHDSTEEKVYSKYTDALLTVAFEVMGLDSATLEERADSADVKVEATKYSFVADAKAFRLSRTAKNQKDFKIESMDKWRGDCDHALVVAPIVQLPTGRSQIYEQAIRRGVCLLGYTHVRVLLRAHAEMALSREDVEAVLLAVLAAPAGVGDAGKDAAVYWTAVHRALRRAHPELDRLLKEEAVHEKTALAALKAEEVAALTSVEDTVRRYSREEAIAGLLKAKKLKSRKDQIHKVKPNGLLDL
jgi:hypothetical protein